MTTLTYAQPGRGLALRLFLQRWAIAVPLVLPLAVFAWLVANPSLNAELAAPVQHFFIVIPVTVTAVVLASGILRTALRLRHAPTFCMGVAYLSIAGIFLVHGLSTPGVFRANNDLVSVSAWLSLLLGGMFLCMSICGENAPYVGWVSKHMPLLLGAILTALVAYGAIGLALTSPAVPTPAAAAAAMGHADAHAAYSGDGAAAGYGDDGYGGYAASTSAASGQLQAYDDDDDEYGEYGEYGEYAAASADSGHVHLPPLGVPQAILLFAGLFCYGSAVYGYWRRYLLTELPLVGALAVSSALLFDAQVSMYLGTVWRLNWWLYHFLLLAGFSVGAGAVLWESYRGRRLHRVIEGMYILRHDVQLELEYTDAIAAMAAATEAKDPDTQGHILRVAQLSCRLGREMGLTPSRLRVLARAGLLHDVGKVQIPDAILKKPGALNDEEWEIMKQHPLLGHDILRGIGRLEEEIKILVAHHERLDGTGYPFGRAGNQISFETRILSVADFFDALTADRPYRKALAWDVALDITKRAAGSHLDPECVGALFRLIETDPAAMQAALNVQPAPSAATPANLYVPELNPRPVHY